MRRSHAVHPSRRSPDLAGEKSMEAHAVPHPSRSAIGLDEPSDKFLTWATHGQYDQLGGVINDEVQARPDFMNPKRGQIYLRSRRPLLAGRDQQLFKGSEPQPRSGVLIVQ